MNHLCIQSLACTLILAIKLIEPSITFSSLQQLQINQICIQRVAGPGTFSATLTIQINNQSKTITLSPATAFQSLITHVAVYMIILGLRKNLFQDYTSLQLYQLMAGHEQHIKWNVKYSQQPFFTLFAGADVEKAYNIRIKRWAARAGLESKYIYG